MSKARLIISKFLICLPIAGAGMASAQSYPNKPIRIVAAEVAGAGDVAARLIAQGISGSLGQPIVIDNRGGSVIIPAEIVAKAPPDGYTLLLYGINLWILPFLQDNVPYDPLRDFSPITLAISSPNVLVVHPSVAAKSVKELIDLAKAKPGVLNYASSTTGGMPHLSVELFKTMAGVNIVRIPFRGSGPALNALLGGQVQLMSLPASSVAPHIRSGKLNALAVTSAQPSVLAPGLPTVAASGVPDYEAVATIALFAPAGTSRPIIKKLNEEIVRALNRPDEKERLLKSGIEAIASSPEELAGTLKSDMVKWGKVIKDAGIRAE